MKKKIVVLLLALLLLPACSSPLDPEPLQTNETIPVDPTPVLHAPQEESETGLETEMPPAEAFQIIERLIPLNGAVFEAPVVSLVWEPIPGAASYRVRIAADSGFERIIAEFETRSPGKYTNPLPAGTYYWKVQAVDASGGVSIFSPVSHFEVRAAGENTLPDRSLRLEVPFLHQGKDSAMLLLESPNKEGAHAWNQPHTSFDPGDPADYENGAFACIAMLNHFYGGNLTQDRLGYEVFKDLVEGPEWDLPYGLEPDQEQVGVMLDFALGGARIEWAPDGNDPHAFQDWIMRQLMLGSPVLVEASGHYVLIAGFETRTETSEWWLNDPAVGPYRLQAALLDPSWAAAFSEVLPAQLEEALLVDRDEDGILDFDETERFQTDPLQPDSDADGISDGAEVFASVFDELHGYALSGNPASRDPDRDGLPMELDSDSDGGGCLDGFEDVNLDGRYRPEFGETSNFDPADDRCYALEMSWTNDDGWGVTEVRLDGSFNLDETRRINGRGVLHLAHAGSCINSELLTGVRLEGRITDAFRIEFDFGEEFEIAAYDAGELSPGCSIGLAIDENWAVSNAVYKGIPDMLVVTLEDVLAGNPQAVVSPQNAPRPAQIQFSVRRIGIEN